MSYAKMAKRVFTDIKEHVAANRPKPKKKRTTKSQDIYEETGIRGQKPGRNGKMR